MDGVAANTKARNQHDYQIPADFRLDRYVGRQAWELGEAEEEAIVAQALFRFPLSLWAERNAHGTLVERRSDGAAIRHFEVHQVAPFLRWVLSLEGEATLLGPPALIDELRTLAQAIASAHAEPNDVG